LDDKINGSVTEVTNTIKYYDISIIHWPLRKIMLQKGLPGLRLRPNCLLLLFTTRKGITVYFVTAGNDLSDLLCILANR
ncbi:MAG: hypothetical protein ACI9WC_001156, partial [Arenicella sp.]